MPDSQTHDNMGKVISDPHKSRFKEGLDKLWGLYQEMIRKSTPQENAGASVPQNPKGYSIGQDAASCRVTEGDFSEMDLSEIRTRFAFDDGSGTFSGLKLPHHDPKSGALRPNCVRAALQAMGGARTGSPMDLGGKREAVQAHLEAHLKEITPKEEKKDMDEIEDLKKQLDDAKAQLQTASQKDAEIKALKERADGPEKELAEFRKAQKDAAWVALKAKMPPGMTHKPEDEAALRELLEKDPTAFANKLADQKVTKPTGEDGEQHDQKDGDNPAAVARELREKTGREPRRK